MSAKNCCSSCWPKRKPPPLHSAIGDGNDRLVQELVNRRRVKKRDTFQRNAVHIACLNSDVSLDTVHLLVDNYPKAVQECDKVGRLPLHSACSNRASLAVISYLVEEYPESITEVTDRGSTALFCALENKAPLTVVRFLLEHDSDALQLETYKLGKTPLHAAVGRGASLPVVRFLLEHQKKGARAEKDAWGKTPLATHCSHVETEARDNLDVLDYLLDDARIREPDRAGMLPLHVAAAHGQSIPYLERLMDAYPDSIMVPDKNGRLPFHAACTHSRIEIPTLKVLLTAHPHALRTFDKNGAVPLHIAIQRKLPVDVILWLIDQEHGAVRTREASSKMYPLHLACQSGSDPAILERLVEIYPQAIATKDATGNTIFHVACTQRLLTLEFAALLLGNTMMGSATSTSSSEAIRTPNDDESLPLHLAVQHRAPMAVLQLILDHYPDALVHKDKKGNTPLHKGFQNNTPLPVLVRLAQANHVALYKRNKRGDTPEDCVSPDQVKKFRKARNWYNMRKAYCPILIRKVV